MVARILIACLPSSYSRTLQPWRARHGSGRLWTRSNQSVWRSRRQCCSPMRQLCCCGTAWRAWARSIIWCMRAGMPLLCHIFCFSFCLFCLLNSCSLCQDSAKICWGSSGQSVWRWHQCAGSHGPNLEHFQDRHVLSFMFNIFWQRRIVKIKTKMLNHFYKFLSGFSFNSLQDPTCAEMPPFGHPRHSWFKVADLQLHK